MCERAENEPYKKFILRWLLENPQWLCAAVELLCLGAVFYYFMSYLDQQVEVQRDTVKELSELSTRIQIIEHKLEK